MDLLIIKHVYSKNVHQQIIKFLLKKNQQTNKLYKKHHKIFMGWVGVLSGGRWCFSIVVPEGLVWGVIWCTF
jgi:hypothetical protein